MATRSKLLSGNMRMNSQYLTTYNSCSKYEDCGTATQNHDDYITKTNFHTEFIRNKWFKFSCKKYAIKNDHCYEMYAVRITYDGQRAIFSLYSEEEEMSLEACVGRASVYSNRTVDVIPRLLLELPKYDCWLETGSEEGIVSLEASSEFEGKLSVFVSLPELVIT